MTCLIAFLIIFCQTAYAQKVEKKFGLGAKISYLNIEDSVIEDYGFSANGQLEQGKLNYGTPPFFGVNFLYYFNQYFSSELSFSYIQSGVKNTVQNTTVKFGDLEELAILLTARLHLPNKSIVTPYIGGGVGYYLNNFDLAGNLILTDIATGALIEADVDNSFGYHASGGIEIPFAKKFTFCLDIKYTWNKVEFNFSNSPQAHENKLNGFTTGVGINYNF